MLITIEGNIGSGKTTVLNRLRERFSDFVVSLEPVSRWMEKVLPDGSSMLEAFYKDSERTALAFQLYVLYTRFEQYKQLDSLGENFVERSFEADANVFGRLMLSGAPSDWFVYKLWASHCIQSVSPTDVIIYLRCEPSVCMARVGKRNRGHGEERISLDYIKKLHDAHEEWLVKDGGKCIFDRTTPNILVIDTSSDDSVDETVDRISEHINALRSKV